MSVEIIINTEQCNNCETVLDQDETDLGNNLCYTHDLNQLESKDIPPCTGFECEFCEEHVYV